MTIPISSSPLQVGATGIMFDGGDSLGVLLSPIDSFLPRLYSPLFAEIVQQYQSREPITLYGFSCNGSCRAGIVATGWDVACTESSANYRLMNDFEWQSYVAKTPGATYNGPELTQTMFDVSTSYGGRSLSSGDSITWENRQINISALYKATTGGNGTLVRRNCSLSEALILYPVKVTDDTLVLNPMSWNTNRTVTLVWRSSESIDDGSMPPPSTTVQSQG